MKIWIKLAVLTKVIKLETLLLNNNKPLLKIIKIPHKQDLTNRDHRRHNNYNSLLLLRIRQLVKV